MTIKPILFNTEMSRAILDGRKTETRRVVKKQCADAVLNSTARKRNQDIPDERFIQFLCEPPCSDGDILWVRETWCKLPVSPGGNARINGVYYYKADGDLRPEGWHGKWRPSIHMPKDAARTFLRVTGVRVERLREMNVNDFLREGTRNTKSYASAIDLVLAHAEKFKEIWNATIKKADLPIYGWNANPWVWVIEFERCEKPEGFL